MLHEAWGMLHSPLRKASFFRGTPSDLPVKPHEGLDKRDPRIDCIRIARVASRPLPGNTGSGVRRDRSLTIDGPGTRRAWAGREQGASRRVSACVRVFSELCGSGWGIPCPRSTTANWTGALEGANDLVVPMFGVYKRRMGYFPISEELSLARGTVFPMPTYFGEPGAQERTLE
jgi:hypothetical protein